VDLHQYDTAFQEHASAPLLSPSRDKETESGFLFT
jgi:hypothetical protein